ncbi:MAG: helix-turn-helix domain-containing protein [Acidimicrobiia bacterium]
MTTPSPRAGTATIRRLRREYLRALEILGASRDQLHEALAAGASTLSIVRDHVVQDGDVSDFADLFDPAALRASLSTALVEFERARHRSQRLLFQLLRAEGMSASDIARRWGISRQLVSRMINESD